jgi:orotate phosphoribosyltransferase-like protein
VVGLSYNEIADSLEVTLATVKWRIWKAREDVQLSLAREGIDVFGERDVRAISVTAVVSVLAPPALPAA